MRRNTSRLIGLLLIFYIIAQSIVLFRGHIARISLFEKRAVPNQRSVVITSSSLLHQTLEEKKDPIEKGVIKLGSLSKYIDVDLTTVKDIKQQSKIYSNFEFQIPNFIDNRSRSLFLKKKENLESLQRSPEQLYGELYVVRNGTYDTKFDCGYKSLNTWVNKDRKVPSNNWYDVLVPLIVPDGHTFQHFLDGTLPKIVQALPVLQNRKVKILMRNLRDRIILEMFDRMNISRDQLVFHSGGVFGANILIYPCITPPVHPELWQEGRRLLTGLSPSSVPDANGFVVFVTRKGCHNCGRRVLNQDKIIEMLKKRYGNNVVRTFEGPQSLAYSVDLFSRARIVMGSHGGGMYNINFAPSKTVVIEFMPTRDNGEVAAAAHQIIWVMAQLLDQDFWRMCVTPTGGSDMNVDIATLEKLLDFVDKRGIR